MKEAIVTLTCPYCHCTQKYTITTGFHRPQTMLCYPEEGGCDRYFAVKVFVKYIPEYYALETPS